MGYETNLLLKTFLIWMFVCSIMTVILVPLVVYGILPSIFAQIIAMLASGVVWFVVYDKLDR